MGAKFEQATIRLSTSERHEGSKLIRLLLHYYYLGIKKFLNFLRKVGISMQMRQMKVKKDFFILLSVAQLTHLEV